MIRGQQFLFEDTLFYYLEYFNAIVQTRFTQPSAVLPYYNNMD